MKTIILTTIIALFTTILSQAQHYSSLKYNQVLPIRNIDAVSLNIHSPNIQIKKSKGSVIVVETVVKLSLSEYHIVEHIKETGRYDISLLKNGADGHVVLSDTKFKDHITFRGERLDEQISYTFYIPEHVSLNDESMAYTIK